MVGQWKKVPARFYQAPGGREPVRDWLKSLPAEDRKTVGVDIQKVEYGLPLQLPYCRSLGQGLWEVRSSLASNRIARVIFTIVGGEMVLLHGFIKKSQKTPRHDLLLAQQRRKEVI
ncbi:MAG TPA: type II toxin-antitoxin system RelE/ParE family toxin [Acidobacteriota bacterium]|nr:type II toxin-antitoxin system RelE/ParE family toxin [Acidobacteriota bacterium]